MQAFKAIKKGIKCFIDLPRVIVGGIKQIFKWKHWKIALDTAVTITTVTTLLVVFLTLKEMQTQRDRAYSPFIIIEDTQVHIDWNGIASDDGVSMSVGENPLVKDGDIVNPMVVSVNAQNIGVGVAKQIHVTINTEKLLYDMIDALNKNTQYNPLRYKLNEDGGVLYLFKGTNSLGSSKITYSDKLYLLPNAEESFNIVIPPLFISVVEEFFVENLRELLENYPLTLNVSCQDIQEKDYPSEIRLFCEPLLLTYGTDGSGYATYKIKSK